MNEIESDFKLFRISTSQLGKIKKNKKLAQEYKENNSKKLKCEFCWNTLSFDLVNLVCLECNNPIKQNVKVVQKEKAAKSTYTKPFQFFDGVKEDEISFNKIKINSKCDLNPKKKTSKVNFNDVHYGKNLITELPKDTPMPWNEKETLKIEGCDANCKCIIM